MKTTIKVIPASPIVLSERDNDATLLVQINEKTFEAKIVRRYENGSPLYRVYVKDFFGQNTLDTLCVFLDYSEVLAQHKVLVDQRDAQRAEADKVQAEKEYDEAETFALTIGLAPVLNKEAWLKLDKWNRRGGPVLTKTLTYKGEEIKVTVSRSDEWWNVYTGYSSDETRKTKSQKKVESLVSDLIDKKKAKIDWDNARKTEEEKYNEEVKAVFPDAVPTTAGSYNSSDRFISRPGYFYVQTKPEGDKVVFTRSWVDPTAPGKDLYRVEKIDGRITEDQLQRIIAILEETR